MNGINCNYDMSDFNFARTARRIDNYRNHHASKAMRYQNSCNMEAEKQRQETNMLYQRWLEGKSKRQVGKAKASQKLDGAPVTKQKRKASTDANNQVKCSNVTDGNSGGNSNGNSVFNFPNSSAVPRSDSVLPASYPQTPVTSALPVDLQMPFFPIISDGMSSEIDPLMNTFENKHCQTPSVNPQEDDLCKKEPEDNFSEAVDTSFDNFGLADADDDANFEEFLKTFDRGSPLSDTLLEFLEKNESANDINGDESVTSTANTCILTTKSSPSPAMAANVSKTLASDIAKQNEFQMYLKDPVVSVQQAKDPILLPQSIRSDSGPAAETLKQMAARRSFESAQMNQSNGMKSPDLVYQGMKPQMSQYMDFHMHQLPPKYTAPPRDSMQQFNSVMQMESASNQLPALQACIMPDDKYGVSAYNTLTSCGNGIRQVRPTSFQSQNSMAATSYAMPMQMDTRYRYPGLVGNDRSIYANQNVQIGDHHMMDPARSTVSVRMKGNLQQLQQQQLQQQQLQQQQLQLQQRQLQQQQLQQQQAQLQQQQQLAYQMTDGGTCSRINGRQLMQFPSNDDVAMSMPQGTQFADYVKCTAESGQNFYVKRNDMSSNPAAVQQRIAEQMKLQMMSGQMPSTMLQRSNSMQPDSFGRQMSRPGVGTSPVQRPFMLGDPPAYTARCASVGDRSGVPKDVMQQQMMRFAKPGRSNSKDFNAGCINPSTTMFNTTNWTFSNAVPMQAGTPSQRMASRVPPSRSWSYPASENASPFPPSTVNQNMYSRFNMQGEQSGQFPARAIDSSYSGYSYSTGQPQQSDLYGLIPQVEFRPQDFSSMQGSNGFESLPETDLRCLDDIDDILNGK